MSGGAGSIADMISRYKYNMSFLRSSVAFNRQKSFAENRKEYLKAYHKGKLEFHHSDPIKTKMIKARVIRQRRNEFLLRIGIFAGIPSIILFLILIQGEKNTKAPESAIEESQITEFQKEENYKSAILEGDSLLKLNDWTGALFAFSYAIELYPNSADAQYRMAVTYLHRCRNEEVNCETALSYIEKLIAHDPANPALYELKGNYYLQNNNPQLADKMLAKSDSLRNSK
jgi:tetratricopeptide (TPR) repeat protein